MIVQRREFGNYLRENSGVKDPSTSSENIVFVCPKRRRFVPTDKLTRLCWASHSASPLMLTKEEELRRGQREKQISQAATRRFSAAKSDSPFKESQSRPRAPTINFKPYSGAGRQARSGGWLWIPLRFCFCVPGAKGRSTNSQ
jgi:hypothetical protein